MRKNIEAVIDAFKAGRHHQEKVCRTDGRVIFSYAEPVAKKMKDGHVWVTAKKFSKTTSALVNGVIDSFEADKIVKARYSCCHTECQTNDELFSNCPDKLSEESP